jgi:hypothetical protein
MTLGIATLKHDPQNNNI